MTVNCNLCGKISSKYHASTFTHNINMLNDLEINLSLTTEDKSMEVNQRWKLIDDYEEEIKEQIEHIQNEFNPISCNCCNENFETHRQLLHHEKKCYGFVREAPILSEKQIEKIIKKESVECTNCGKTYTDTATGKAKYFLNRHYKKCNGENPKHLKNEINKLCDKYGVKELKQILDLCKNLQ